MIERLSGSSQDFPGLILKELTNGVLESFI